MRQLEETLGGLTDRSADALEAVHQGVEAIGSKLGLIEQKKERHTGRWLIFSLVLAVLIGGSVALRRRSTSTRESADELGEPSSIGGMRSTAAAV